MAKIADPRSYELTYLLPVGFTDTELNKLKAGIQALIEKHQGKVTATEEWGKNKLAYAIKHGGKMHAEAVYVHTVFTGDPGRVQALDRDMFLQPQVIRHLLVLAQAAPKAGKPAKAAAKSSEEVTGAQE